jgi:transposase
MEGLSDRQAAEAVRSRSDWKYALGLDLDDPGFDYSVLSRISHTADRRDGRDTTPGHHARAIQSTRPAQGSWEAANRLYTCAGGHSYPQPTRKCRRDGCRAALNAIATVAPEWLREHAAPEWFDRYSTRIEESRLPKGQEAREQYAELIGADGSHLLSALYVPSAPAQLKDLPAVEILRRTWVCQYYAADGSLRWRKAEDLPPAAMRSHSPYDPQAHYGNKRSHTWTGDIRPCDRNWR